MRQETNFKEGQKERGMETGSRRKEVWRQETGGKRYGDRRQEERVWRQETGGKSYEDRRRRKKV